MTKKENILVAEDIIDEPELDDDFLNKAASRMKEGQGKNALGVLANEPPDDILEFRFRLEGSVLKGELEVPGVYKVPVTGKLSADQQALKVIMEVPGEDPFSFTAHRYEGNTPPVKIF